jgi:nucleoside-diphosphate-sugar epimerase
MTTPTRILITGGLGQVGSELYQALCTQYGEDNILLTDVRKPENHTVALFETLDATDAPRLAELVSKHKITQIYHLAAILSARGEQDPLWAWKINVDSTLNVFEVAREKQLHKVYVPSSIAAFGPDTPKQNTPQACVMNPSTVYGISKQACERWGEYYFKRYGLDIRSLRYPGLISYKTLPGGGTTDYAVDIFYKALQQGSYECFLSPDTYLPMMYMPDAIRATVALMEAPSDNIRTRDSYNLTALSFSPAELAKAIQQHLPDFTISYKPDFRQQIADSWPASIDDSVAQAEWGWQPQYDLEAMVAEMLEHIRTKLQKTVDA